MLQAGNVGALLAPGLVILAVTVRAQFVPWLPLGGVGLLAAAAAMALPETLGMPVAHTIQVGPACLMGAMHDFPALQRGSVFR